MRLKDACEIAHGLGYKTVGEAVLWAIKFRYYHNLNRQQELEELKDDIERATKGKFLDPDEKIEDFLKHGTCDLCDEILRVKSPEWRKRESLPNHPSISFLLRHQ